MTEQFANFARSSLARACGTNDDVIYVANSSTFPALGDFRVVVQAFDASGLNPISAPEIMVVTSVGGNGTFTVERGAENTTPIAFRSGAFVTHIITAGVMQALEAGSGGGSSGTVIKVNSFPYAVPAQSGLTVYNIYAGGNAVTLNLPASPAANQISRFVDAGNTSSANPITINGNGNNIVAYGSGTNSSIQLAQNGSDKWLSWDSLNYA